MAKNKGTSKKSFWKRQISVPAAMLLALVLVAVSVGAVVMLGPASTPAPATVGRMSAAIAGIDSDNLWGSQYDQDTFTVSITENTYTAAKTSVPYIIVQRSDAVACATLVSDGFVLEIENQTSVWVAIVGVDATGISKAGQTDGTDFWSDGCVFIPTAVDGNIVVAGGATSDTWDFRVILAGTSSDVSNLQYDFSAQFAVL